MFYLVNVQLPDSLHPSTWDTIDLAMNEVGFLAPSPDLPGFKTNTHCLFGGIFAGTVQELRTYINQQWPRHSLPDLAMDISEVHVKVT